MLYVLHILFLYFYRITHTVILEDPYSDPDGLIVPNRSPEPPLEVLQVDNLINNYSCTVFKFLYLN